MNFKTPKAVIWEKVSGDITAGLLTNNLKLIPEDKHPKGKVALPRGFKRLFCLNRKGWVSLYTKSIIHFV